MVRLHSKSFAVFALVCSVAAATEASTCAADGGQECQTFGTQLLQKKAHKSEIKVSTEEVDDEEKQPATGVYPLPVVAAVQVSTEAYYDNAEIQSCPKMVAFVQGSCQGDVQNCQAMPDKDESTGICKEAHTNSDCEHALSRFASDDKNVADWYRSSCVSSASMDQQRQEGNDYFDGSLLQKSFDDDYWSGLHPDSVFLAYHITKSSDVGKKKERK